MTDIEHTSRLPGFYDQSLPERARTIGRWAGLSPAALAALDGSGGLTAEQADHMIENVVGLLALPLGVAANFVVNGREVLVPMAIEEPSVVAGASFMAKLARAGGGFVAHVTAPEMIGQMQILDVADLAAARLRLLERKAELLEQANRLDPVLIKAGGGARDLEVRLIEQSPIGPFLVAHLIYDTRDAMGANAVNTACENLAPAIEQITGGRVHLRILSNLADRRLARVRCAIPAAELAFGEFSGERVRDGIIEAYAFAAADPYRAATHNKGIMNGVDAVVIATGNDWRAIEAGAHAYAARGGPLHLAQHLGARRCRATGGHAGNAAGGGHRGRRHPRAPHGTGRAQTHGRHHRRASWPKLLSAWAWRRTWPRCAPWPPKASSAAT